MLEAYKDKLSSEGYAVIPLSNGPFDSTTFETIASATSPEKISYTATEGGDTDESARVEFFRLLHPSFSERYLPEVLDIIEGPKVTDFIKNATGQKSYFIDRCQAHFYSPQGFCGRHTDAEHCPDWSHTILLMLDPCEEGGEFVFWNLENEKYELDLAAGDLLILDSRFPHEVLPIKRGTRNVFIFFINVS